MATANELEAYNGNPELAFGSSALPAGSNNAIVDTSPSVKYWADYAANKLLLARENQAQLRAKQLQAQKDVQQALDQGNFKLWDKSQDWFNPLWKEYSELVVDVAKKGNWENIQDPDYQKAIQLQNKLLQGTQYSMQQKEHYSTSDTWYQEHQDKVQPTAQGQLDTYANTIDPFERAKLDINFDPKIGFDLTKYYTTVLNRLKEDNPTLTAGQADQYGYVPYTHSGTLNVEGATSIAEGAWKSDPDAEDFGKSLIDKGQTQATNPHDAFIENFVSATVPRSLQGELKGINYAYGETQAKKPNFDYQEGILLNIATPKGKVFKFTDKDGAVRYEVKDANGKAIPYSTDKNGNAIPSDGTNEQTSFTTQKEADEFANKAGGTQTMETLGGWFLSGVGEFPSNINITASQRVWDLNGNRVIQGKDLTIGSEKIDGVAVVDTYIYPNGALEQTPKHVTAEDIKKYNLTPIRVSQVHLDNGGTYTIPYDKNVSIPFENALKAKSVPDAKLPSNTPIGNGKIPQSNTQQSNQQPQKKSYSYNGKPYTQEQVEAAAKASGLTVDEYAKQAGLNSATSNTKSSGSSSPNLNLLQGYKYGDLGTMSGGAWTKKNKNFDELMAINDYVRKNYSKQVNDWYSKNGKPGTIDGRSADELLDELARSPDLLALIK